MPLSFLKSIQTMKNNKQNLFLFALGMVSLVSTAQNFHQNKQKIYNDISKEVQNNNNLDQLAFELLDVIGPRLVGSPEMNQAHNWVVKTYKKWNIKAENVAYGEWKSWQRGTTEITLTAPRIKTIDGMQLAWNAATKKPIEAEIVAMPVFETKVDFDNWSETVKGKIVLISAYQNSGRPESQWKEHATEEDFFDYKAAKEKTNTAWNNSLKATGKNTREMVQFSTKKIK